MQLDHPLYRLGVFGVSGTGKTTYALSFVANAPGVTCRFLYDPEGEFSVRLKLQAARTPEELGAAIATGWVCFDPYDMFSDPDSGLEFFAAWVFAVCEHLPGTKLFVLDEMQSFSTARTLPTPLKEIVWRGRRRGIDSVFIANSPNLLHNTVRNNLSEVVCFTLTDPISLEFAGSYGFATEEVQNLPAFEFIARDRKGTEYRSTDVKDSYHDDTETDYSHTEQQGTDGDSPGVETPEPADERGKHPVLDGGREPDSPAAPSAEAGDGASAPEAAETLR